MRPVEKLGEYLYLAPHRCWRLLSPHTKGVEDDGIFDARQPETQRDGCRDKHRCLYRRTVDEGHVDEYIGEALW